MAADDPGPAVESVLHRGENGVCHLTESTKRLVPVLSCAQIGLG